MEVRINGLTRGTQVNGPGVRNMVHLQGCSIHCAGCFNQHTWSHTGGQLREVEGLARDLLADHPDGVTISGGEPMEQPEGLLHLLRALRAQRPDLSTLLYSGLTPQQLERHPMWPSIRPLLSVAVVGPYVRAQAQQEGLRSSRNQQVMLLDGRHRLDELVQAGQLELLIDQDGSVLITGFPPERFIQQMEAP